MNRFSVEVIVTFRPSPAIDGLFAEIVQRDIEDEPWTSAGVWALSDDASLPPTRLTLTLMYNDVEGPDEAHAEALACAIFDRERGRASFPSPESVLAHVVWHRVLFALAGTD